ncbi:putative domain HDIG [Archaeoglobus sulfaticallidus PM70-1]|uniref:Putative domain HDIG n=1 Tax=Archaeoglobus sulfaticallidus PM70-1 TaxID=387631 RepID=N0BE53_9EURY|nr:HD domain-containing protein [Archaeoglobus sulfaticallidus]AGK60492.1 putative domain HDIG [Archaeoglobus sulfaticallidus PM70-1]
MHDIEILELEEDELIKALSEYLKEKGVSNDVLNHTFTVLDSALRIANRMKLSDEQRKLIIAGAMLHDVGRSLSHGMDHAVLGAEILRKDGFDDRIIKIVERHIGAGLTAKEAKKFGLPERDYIPETLEEKLVALADNLVAGDRILRKEEYIRHIKQKFRDEKEVLDRHLALLNEFEEFVD